MVETEVTSVAQTFSPFAGHPSNLQAYNLDDTTTTRGVLLL
jgi:hypothetical protein